MGIFSLKRQFKIGHIVQLEGDVVQIGTGYVRDLISIFPDGEIIGNRTFMPFKNADLEGYWKALHADRKKMLELLNEPDQFDELKPVWTYKNGRVITCFCEEYGYPNTTNLGELMYENTFFQTRNEAKRAAINNAKSGVWCCWRTFLDSSQSFFRSILRLSKEVFYLFISFF